MANTPGDLRYTDTHEWARIDGDLVTVGITDHAQSELGDIVYLDLPEPGRIVQAEEPFGEIESVKAVSELFSPVSGEVIEANTAILDATEVVNQDPYGNGWLIRVRMSNSSELLRLLDAEQYGSLLAEEGH